MPKLVTAVLAKDEADRYLKPVIEHCLTFSDTVLVLDDGSTDNTIDLAVSLGAVVRTRAIGALTAWGNESPARAELWDWAAAEAGDGWVLINDADMILKGDVRGLTKSWDVNSWAFPLLDLWTPDGKYYRQDGFWQGHLNARPWLFAPSRVPEGWRPEWPTRGVHCGHAPSNYPLVCGIAPTDVVWHHWAYASPADRVRKAQRYETVTNQLTEFERRHAESILDLCLPILEKSLSS